MIKCQRGTGDDAEACGGFDKGRWPVSWPGDRAGFWPARISPMWAIARVPLSNPPRPREAFASIAALCFSRQPTGAWRRRCGSASGSCGERAVLAARAARRAALKPYRNFAQNPASCLDPWSRATACSAKASGSGARRRSCGSGRRGRPSPSPLS